MGLQYGGGGVMILKEFCIPIRQRPKVILCSCHVAFFFSEQSHWEVALLNCVKLLSYHVHFFCYLHPGRWMSFWQLSLNMAVILKDGFSFHLVTSLTPCFRGENPFERELQVHRNWCELHWLHSYVLVSWSFSEMLLSHNCQRLFI